MVEGRLETVLSSTAAATTTTTVAAAAATTTITIFVVFNYRFRSLGKTFFFNVRFTSLRRAPHSVLHHLGSRDPRRLMCLEPFKTLGFQNMGIE